MARSYVVIELSDDEELDARRSAASSTAASLPASASLSGLELTDAPSPPPPPAAAVAAVRDVDASAVTPSIKEEHIKQELAPMPEPLALVPEPIAMIKADVEPIAKAEPPSIAPPEPVPVANSVMIMGYKVDFPDGKRPFPAQLAVMNKVLMALKTRQHALLESPTGSGKTLALLCSSLTFQRYLTAELVKEQAEQRKLAAAAHAAKKQQIEELNAKRAAEEYVRMIGAAFGSSSSSSTGQAPSATRSTGDDDDDFVATQPSFDQFRYQTAAAPVSARTSDGWISMASKKDAMRRDHAAGHEDGEDDDEDDFYSQDTTQADEQVKSEPSLLTKRRALPASFSTSLSQSSALDSDMEPPPSLKKLKTKRTLPTSFSLAGAQVPDPDPLFDRTHESFHATAENDSEKRTTSARVVPPTIYFCSRTHSQLSQVVDELKNCPVSYLDGLDPTNPFSKQLKMCVLGSKANLCVNKKVNKDLAQVDDKCRALMDAGSCSFANKRRKTNDLRRTAPPVWDMEDIVALGKRHRECAYLHTRDVLLEANIVLCPYIYILNPSIRNACNISLKNAIVIFDEAHNVEDTCRSSASLEVNADILALAIKAFTAVIKHGARPPTYHSLLKVLNGFHRWLMRIDANAKELLVPTGFEEEGKVWDGTDALAMFAEYAGMTPETFPTIKADLAAVELLEKELGAMGEAGESTADVDEERGANPRMLLGTLALSTVQSILNVVDYMFREELKYLDDFKLVVRKMRNARNVGGRFRSAYTADAANDGWELKLCIWCLNAAVAFSDVVKLARSVILTSGTLSPMDSFAGELGTDFPIRLEANHVVDMRKQVFAGAIMRGPGGVDLSSTYRNQQEFKYQDSMGQLLLQYAQVIPGGVLMFLPSYSLMEKLAKRWRQTGVWAKIDAIKTMFSEPRKAGKDFDALLDDYKHAVAAGRSGAAGARTGAIFIAVYRGKVSEGIDFSNDNARAVLAVGIPFPSVKELQVSLKRTYQDEKSRVDKTLVNGHTWYNLQAFRALNQALGRCIRHRQDYGTILLLDSRHRGQAYVRSLSKWMRPFIQEVESSEHVLEHFGAFFARNEREFGTGASAATTAQLKAEPMVLGYEREAPGARSNPFGSAAPESTLQSTMSSVRAYLEKKRLEDEGPRVFSLFQQGKPRASGAAGSSSSGGRSSGSGGRGGGGGRWRGGKQPAHSSRN